MPLAQPHHKRRSPPLSLARRIIANQKQMNTAWETCKRNRQNLHNNPALQLYTIALRRHQRLHSALEYYL